MAFIDQLGKMITNAGQETATKAKNLSSITKLNNTINSLHIEINRLSQELGKAYYERHKNDEVFPEDSERMTAIKNAYAEISKYQEQIDQIKGMGRCPNCGASTPADSVFCSSCGNRLVHEAAVSTEGKTCHQCHATVGPNDLFCMACGADLRTETAEINRSE